MKLIRFMGNGDGEIDGDCLHLDGASGMDYTLCGITLDGDQETAGEFELVDGKAVTCPACKKIVQHCRGVRIG